MRKIIHALILTIAVLSLSACSTTSNLLEGETLYRGIKGLEYNQPATQEADTIREGVITALADAYSKVEGLLTGDIKAAQPQQSEQEKRDSLKRASRIDQLASAEAKEEVEAVLAYAPNGALMGSSHVTHPFPVRLWIYNRYVNSRRRFGRWMFRHFAATPVYISTVNPKTRCTVAQNTLRGKGYFQAHVTHDTIPMNHPRKAKLTYRVETGPLFHLDSIAYQLFSQRADSIIKATMPRKRLLSRGDPFCVATLDKERTRLSETFRNAGYYFFRPSYITFRADTLQAPLRVALQVRPSDSAPRDALHPYYIGNTRLTVLQNGLTQVTDSISVKKFTYRYSTSGKRAPLHAGTVMRHCTMKRGDLFSQQAEEQMQKKLLSTNLFSALNIRYVPRDSSFTGDTLDLDIQAMLAKPYDGEFQAGLTAKSNGQVGPGITFGMKKHNAFRGGETLGLKAWGSYEWQTGADVPQDRSLLNSYEYGANLSLSWPRLIPFFLERRKPYRTTSTDVQLDGRAMSRAGYFSRVSLSTSFSYTIQNGTNEQHQFTLLSLDYQSLQHTTARFDSITNANQALYVSMRDQFVPSMEYTYTWTSKKHHPRSLRVSVKEAGNLTSLVYAACGQDLSRKGKKMLGVPFAQYLRVTAQYTHRFPLTRRSSLATRVMGGVAYSYGNAVIPPYSDLFTVGGACSVRAFSVRSIGPGRHHPGKSQYSYVDQAGDMKLEANVEYRFPIVGKLYGATFLDAGNVWLLRRTDNMEEGQFSLRHLGRDIALGTGAGLRYDLDFLVIRFDVGVGLHAPYDTGKSGYYNMTRFSRSLGYHLAIGYPF
ncbi:MAG: BamA/TamA family outer membrane protein [Bacteroidaceae bacterium]